MDVECSLNRAGIRRKFKKIKNKYLLLEAILSQHDKMIERVLKYCYEDTVRKDLH